MENKNDLTEKEIFEQIKLLQKEITSNSTNQLYRLSEAINEMKGEDGNIDGSSVSELCTVFSMREETLRKMLEFYIRLYDEARKAEKE